MKNFNHKFSALLFGLCLIWVSGGLAIQAQEAPGDGPDSFILPFEENLSSNSDICANPTYSLLSGTGCMSPGQTSATVQIRVEGEPGATFKLWNHFNNNSAGNLVDELTATAHRDGIVPDFVIFNVSISGPTDLWVSQHTGPCDSGREEILNLDVYPRPDAPTVANQTICEGESFTMTPTGSANYTWYTDAGKTNIDHYGPSYTLTLPNGVTSKDYWVSATNAGNCEGSGLTQVTITVDQKAEPQTLQQTEFSCPGGTDYEIKMLSSQSSYTYKLYKQGSSGALQTWTAPATNNVAKTFDITSPGTYYVEADNKGECAGTTTQVGSIVVNSYPEPDAINAIANISVCEGENIGITPGGGGQHQDTYRWFTAASGSSTHFSDRDSYSATPGVGVTDYYIAAVSVNGCTGPRERVTVTVNALPDPPGGLNDADFCSGDRPTMTPTGGYTYHWYTANNGGTLLHSGTSWQPELNELGDTNNFWVETESSDGCLSTSRTSIILTKKYEPVDFTVQQDGLPCDGDGPFIIRVPNPENSPDGVNYTLFETDNPGNSYNQQPYDGNGIYWSVPEYTNYTVRATKNNVCNGVLDKYIHTDYSGRPSIPVADDGTSITACKGANITLSVDGGGDSQLTYYWYTNSDLSAASQVGSAATLNITVPTTGTATYHVISRNSNNCASSTRTITVTGEVVNSPGGLSDADFCSGDRPTMTPTGGYTYHWYTANNGGTLLHSGTSWQPELNELGDTNNFWVETESSDGCLSTSRTSIILTKKYEPVDFTVQQDGLPCDGDGPFIIRVPNPENSPDGVNYTLFETDNPGNSYNQQPYDGNGIYWSVPEYTNYTVRATKNNVCNGVLDKYIHTDYSGRPSIPVADDGTSITACKGANITLSVDGGGDSQLTYYWYTNSDLSAASQVGSAATLNITVPTTGTATYHVISRNSNNCASSTRTITVTGETVDPPEGLSDADFCEGNRPTMTPTPRSGETYQWFTAQTGGTLLHRGASWTPALNDLGDTNVYWVEAESALGCFSVRTRVELTKEFGPNEFDFVQDDIPCDEDGPYILRVPNPQSAAEVTYTLYESDNSGVTYSPETYDGNGIHWIVTQRTGFTVKAEAINGCGIEEMHMTPTFTQRPGMPAADDGTGITACKESPLTLSVDEGGTHQLTYYWYDNSDMIAGNEVSTTATLDITVPASGSATYYVVSRNSNECQSPTQVITVTGEEVSAPGNLSDDTMCGSSTPLMEPSGGVSYKWYTVENGGTPIAEGETFQPVSLAIGDNTYYVSTVSALGCESEDRTEVTFTRIALPDPFTVVQAVPSCDDDGPYFFKVDNPEDGVIYTMHSDQDFNVTYTEDYRNAAEIVWEVPSNQVYRVIAHRTGDCASATIDEIITPDVSDAPSTPALVTSASHFGCDGDMAILTVTNPANENVTDYYWYYDAGLTQSVPNTSNAASITVPVGTTTTHYYVVSKSDIECRSVTPRHFTVVGNSLPLPLLSIDQVNVCEGATTATIPLPNITGNGTWRVFDVAENGIFIDSGSDDLIVPVTSETTIFHVERVSEEGCSATERTPVTVYRYPTLQTFSLQHQGLGFYCESTSLRLDGSTDGVTYRLLRNGAVEQTQTGDGNEILWENITESGTYSVEANWPGCTPIAMANELPIEVDRVTTFSVSGGGTVCEGEGLDVTVDGSQSDYSYFLKIDGEVDMTTEQPGDDSGAALTWSSLTASGSYQVVVLTPGCGYVEMNNTVQLNITEKPDPPLVEDIIIYELGVDRLFRAYSENPDAQFNWYDENMNFLYTSNRSPQSDIQEEIIVYVEALVDGCVSEKSKAKVIYTLAQPPSKPLLVEACGEYFLRAQGSPPANVSWYWQGTEKNGTDKLLDATRYDYRLLKDGTYYIRAYDEINRLWGPIDTASDPVVRSSPGRITPVDCDDINATYVAPVPDALNAGANYNYVGTYFVTKAGMTEEQIIAETDNNRVTLSTSFLDGLGRPIQTVNRGASPDGKDIVNAQYYDAFSQESKTYLPYASIDENGALKVDAFGEQEKFFGGDAATSMEAFYPDETVYYDHNILEKSPMARPRLSMGAGDAWTGSGVGIRTDYDVNSLEEGIRIWILNAEGLPESGVDDIYPTGALKVTIRTDEEGVVTKEYKDKEGKTIVLKKQLDTDAGIEHTGWLTTYSIFDDFDNLIYTIPPKAIERLEEDDWMWIPLRMNGLVYEYAYDQRGRKVSQVIPGASLEEYVYDKLDRLVASQNGNQKHHDEPHWIFTKYDAMNRPVVIGAYKTSETREDIQTMLDAGSFSLNVVSEIPENPEVSEATIIKTDRHETGITSYKASESITLLPGFDTSGEEIDAEINANLSINNKNGYNDGTFPTDDSNIDLYEVIYYDDYRFTQKQYDASHPEFTTTELSDKTIAMDHPRARKTGNKVRILGTNQWLLNVHFYDDKGRIVQNRSENQHGGEKIETRQFDRADRVTQSYDWSTNPEASEDNAIHKKTDYDHFGRRLQIDHKLKGAEEFKTIGVYSYDRIGRMEERTVGDNLETINYDFNIRGWLTGFNTDQLKHDEILKEHFFALELSYEKGFTNRDRSGNITGVKWQTKTRPEMLAFGYDYDQDDRIKVADYSQGHNWSNSSVDYSVGNISYDHNGNILSLTRHGMASGIKTKTDDLEYIYGVNTPNQLLKVVDRHTYDQSDPTLIVSQASSEGFYNPNEDENDFIYDHNGNLLSDANKGIAYIRYNYMNLPEYVQMVTEEGEARNVTYLYDAAGVKLSEITNDNGNITKIDYTDGYTYQDNELKSLSHQEGRIRKTRAGFIYDYVLRDHLGNGRITLTEGHQEYIYLATMETDDHPVEGVNLGDYEREIFLNTDASRVVYNNANYTVDLDINTNEAASLNGLDPNRRVGPGKIINVMPGDMVDIEAFAYYEGAFNGSSTAIDPLIMASAASNIFGGLADGNLEQQFIHTGFNNNAIAIAVGDDGVDDASPRAYLNYVLFDENFEFEDAGFTQVSEEAQGEHQQLKLSRAVIKPGYLYIYVSNETNADFNVYFDDLRIKHKKGLVVAESHQYPFGSSMKELSYSDPALEGIAEADKLNLGLTDLGFRLYDPILGRFTAVDPRAELSRQLTTYQFAANDPISKIDYLGLFPLPLIGSLAKDLFAPGSPLLGTVVQGVTVTNEDDDSWDILLEWIADEYQEFFVPTKEGAEFREKVKAKEIDWVPEEYRLEWNERRRQAKLDALDIGNMTPEQFAREQGRSAGFSQDRFSQPSVDPRFIAAVQQDIKATEQKKGDSDKTARDRNIDRRAGSLNDKIVPITDENGKPLNGTRSVGTLTPDGFSGSNREAPPTAPPNENTLPPPYDGSLHPEDFTEAQKDPDADPDPDGTGLNPEAFWNGFFGALMGDLEGLIDLVEYADAVLGPSLGTCNASAPQAVQNGSYCQGVFKKRLELMQLTNFLAQLVNDQVLRDYMKDQLYKQMGEYIEGIDDLTEEGANKRGEAAYGVVSSFVSVTQLLKLMKVAKLSTVILDKIKIPGGLTRALSKNKGKINTRPGDKPGETILMDADGNDVGVARKTGDGENDFEIELSDDKLSNVDPDKRAELNKQAKENPDMLEKLANDKDGSFANSWNNLQKTDLDEASKKDPEVVELAKDMFSCGG